MPANKNAVLRYKFLDELLSDRLHYYSMEELTEKVNERLEDLGYPPVVSRTLEKDLVFLQERPFRIPLERNRIGGKSYIKYASRSYSIFTHELSKEEISLLCEVLNTVGQFSGLPNFDWLDGLRNEMGLKKQKQVLSFSNNPLLKNTNILASLYEYVASNCVLSITYQRFNNSTQETFRLHPYLLKEYNNRWYLVGWQPEMNRIFTLPIDRIIEFESLQEEQFKQYNGNIEDHFKDTIGITVYDDSKPERILFWASSTIVPYIETKPFHSSQTSNGLNEFEIRKKYNLPNEGRIYELRCTLNLELEQTLTHHFGDLIVLQPTNLRSSITGKIELMKKRYDNLEKKT
jgi:predicted DNA-binding transcriptional regulator YafY